MSVTVGRPRVSVPVLSSATVRTFPACSSASLLRNKIPSSAPRPAPTMIAVGVARPSAHGHAITSTATILIKAWLTSPPTRYQPKNVSSASSTTAGTKILETRSTKACTGALLSCAACTSRTMFARAVSDPTLVARNLKAPCRLRVAPNTLAPTPFSAGSASPVSIDSSTEERPSTTRPSTAMLSPGRTSTISPTCTVPAGTSTSAPARTRRAIRGCNASRRRITAEARPLARASSSFPRPISVIIIAAVSK